MPKKVKPSRRKKTSVRKQRMRQRRGQSYIASGIKECSDLAETSFVLQEPENSWGESTTTDLGEPAALRGKFVIGLGEPVPLLGKSSSGTGEPALSQGESLNALRLAPPQGSLPTPTRSIPPRSDSPPCVCTPPSVPSLTCDAGQSKLADSNVCSPTSEPSPPCDAASRLKTKDALIHTKGTSTNGIKQYAKHTLIKSSSMSETKLYKDESSSYESSSNGVLSRMLYTVQSSYHQGQIEIFGNNSGKQCVSNSLCSMAYAMVKSQRDWGPFDLDTILHNGNELYSFIQASSTMNNEYLLVSELPDTLDMFERSFSFTFQTPDVGIFGTNSEHVVDDFHFCSTLSDAIRKSLNLVDACFVTFTGNTIAIAKKDSVFYVFDSHARNAFGLPDQNGKCVLLAMGRVEDVIQHCYRLGTAQLAGIYTQFEVTGVTVQCISYTDRAPIISRPANTPFTEFDHEVQPLSANRPHQPSVEAPGNSSPSVPLTKSDYKTKQKTPQGLDQINVKITGVSRSIFSYSPLTITRKRELCNGFGIRAAVDSVCEPEQTSYLEKLRPPEQKRIITADGNCFFRALSYAISNTEVHHNVIRKVVLKFMQENQNAMSAYLPIQFKTVSDYVESSQMEKTWNMGNRGRNCCIICFNESGHLHLHR